jgi:hypothetical protein
MKIQRKIKELLKEKNIGLWNPCYFLNLKDAKLTWEEKKALLHIFEIIAANASPSTNICSGIQFDLDTPGEVEYFSLGFRPEGYNPDDWNDYEDLYIFNYYLDDRSDKYYIEDLSKRYGAHWGSFKAGLRGWYDHLLKIGRETRIPTSYKSVAV